jgi:hypothetical protein
LGLLHTINSIETFISFAKYLTIASTFVPDPDANNIIFFKSNINQYYLQQNNGI